MVSSVVFRPLRAGDGSAISQHKVAAPDHSSVALADVQPPTP
jgi:hypothetical protein